MTRATAGVTTAPPVRGSMTWEWRTPSISRNWKSGPEVATAAFASACARAAKAAPAPGTSTRQPSRPGGGAAGDDVAAGLDESGVRAARAQGVEGGLEDVAFGDAAEVEAHAVMREQHGACGGVEADEPPVDEPSRRSERRRIRQRARGPRATPDGNQWRDGGVEGAAGRARDVERGCEYVEERRADGRPLTRARLDAAQFAVRAVVAEGVSRAAMVRNAARAASRAVASSAACSTMRTRSAMCTSAYSCATCAAAGSAALASSGASAAITE
jgi:hypothetical protein